jgi:hypothetical protein
MRTLRLARIAAEAEGLRLRRQARRAVSRMAAGLIGLMFIGWALAFAHLAAWYWLRDTVGWPEAGTAIVLAGGDLVIAAFLVLLAARSAPGRVEREALLVRRHALESATGRLELATELLQALRVVGSLLPRRK